MTSRVDSIFYSWQSDLDSRTNRGFIRSALDGAARSAVVEDANREFRVESDTQGVPGAPDVKQTILAKIEGASIFVADVSLINTGSSKRPLTPNPNVMFELGFAVHVIGWNRIILVVNLATGAIEDLPFDIRMHRPLIYTAAPGTSELSAARSELREKLARAIEVIAAVPLPIVSKNPGSLHKTEKIVR